MTLVETVKVNNVQSLIVLGDNMVVSGSTHGMDLWDMTIGHEKNRHIETIGTGHSVTHLIVLKDGRLCYSSVEVIEVYDLQKKSTEKRGAHEYTIHGLAPLPDGGFVSVSLDRTMMVWNERLYVVKTIKFNDTPQSVASFHDGRVAVGFDGKVIVYNSVFGDNYELNFKSDSVNHVSFSHDGKIVCGTWLGKILVYDGDFLERSMDHGGKITALVELPDGRFASASSNLSIGIWDIESGENDMFEIEGYVYCLAVLDNGYLIGDIKRSMYIGIWDIGLSKSMGEIISEGLHNVDYNMAQRTHEGMIGIIGEHLGMKNELVAEGFREDRRMEEKELLLMKERVSTEDDAIIKVLLHEAIPTLKVAELKSFLRRANERVGGNKEELESRIVELLQLTD